jgi:uncharacterized membrane protein YdbT with pleckstrin-like domain
MSYVGKVLQPGETVLARGEYHWIIYMKAVWLFVIGIVVFLMLKAGVDPDAASGPSNPAAPALAALASLAFVIMAGIALLRAWFMKRTTELAITDRRVIFKTGFIRRITAEMNMDKVETVNVNQSVLGRILNYGTIHIRGTGAGIEHLHQISHPLEIRTAVTAK